MPADTTVKYFHSAMAGAPTLNGVAGSLITVLDACLVNGFGLVAVSSLVVSSSIATVTTSGHSAEVGSVVLIDGATPSGLNGQKKVLSVGGGNTTLTFDATGISDQTATGTISVKLAPAGWEKAFSGTNLAAYKSLDVAGTGCYLRVNDTIGRYARAIGYETMTGVSTGSRPFPTTAQLSGGVFWDKSTLSNSSARGWSVASDGRIVYLALRPDGSAPSSASFVAFGDLTPVYSADAWACVISGAITDLVGVVADVQAWYPNADSDDPQGVWLARAHGAAVGSIAARKGFAKLYNSASGGKSGGFGNMQYPNGPDGGLYLTRHNILEHVDFCLRALSPGLYCCPQTLPVDWMTVNTEFDGEADLSGRRVRVVPYSAQTGDSAAFAFLDSTGPWR